MNEEGQGQRHIWVRSPFGGCVSCENCGLTVDGSDLEEVASSACRSLSDMLKELDQEVPCKEEEESEDESI